MIFNGGTQVSGQGMRVLAGGIRHETGEMLGLKMEAWQRKLRNTKKYCRGTSLAFVFHNAVINDWTFVG